jgi:hypothetical protein
VGFFCSGHAAVAFIYMARRSADPYEIICRPLPGFLDKDSARQGGIGFSTEHRWPCIFTVPPHPIPRIRLFPATYAMLAAETLVWAPV